MAVDAQWAAALSAASAVVSSLIAFVAVLIAVRNERRSREVVKSQIYLSLREGFLGIYKELGDLEEKGAVQDVRLRLVRQAYWHHAFDEWYVSHSLAPRELRDLWDQFFKTAARAGYAHASLQRTLEELTADKSAGFGAYASEFILALKGDQRER